MWYMPIEKLTDLVIAQIAAGEVIETPVAAIKELVENSIDAGAKNIEIQLRDLGLTSLIVRDDGKGMDVQDLPLALESFATSKIHSSDDLYNIVSMGFRGEALSSIRSISRVTIESKLAGANRAWKITGEGQTISAPQPCALPSGTRVIVENLFFNVPIRKKFLHGDAQIKQSIMELIISYAISHYHLGFKCAIDEELLVNTPIAKSLSERLEQVYSRTFMNSMVPVYHEDIPDNKIKIHGYLSGSGFYHSRAVFIKFFVNNRPVVFAPLVRLLKKAYGELLPSGKFPSAFIFIDIDPNAIDVNVHPQKKEIRFKDETEISNAVFRALSRGIENRGSVDIGHKLRKISRNHPAATTSENPLYALPLELNHPLHVNDGGKIVFQEPQVLNSHRKNILRPEIIHSRLFNTFILASSGEGIFLMDQHTAHERIQYEKYLMKIRKNEISKQALLVPIVIDLSPSEKNLLENNFARISEFGFDLEDFGPAGIKINSVPAYLVKGEESDAIRILLTALSQDNKINAEILFDNMAKSLSCRSALKKGEQASLQDYSEILEKLYTCEQPLRCPHGRPTIIHISKNDILDLFNRPANQ